MSHPLFVGKFITRSGIDGKSAICYIGRAGSVDNTQSVWQNKSIVWHEFSSLHGFSLQNTIILIVVTEKYRYLQVY